MSRKRTRIDPRDEYPEFDGIRELNERNMPVMAMVVVVSFCMAAIAAVIGAFATGNLSQGVDILRTTAAVFSAPLGFVLGYYFARKET